MFSNSQYSQWMPTSGTGQNPNLGRYVPPMMNQSDYGWGGNPNSWMHQGGYAYNTPQAYTGFPSAGGNSPFNFWGGGSGGMTHQQPMNGQGWGGNQGFQQMLQQLYQQMFGGQQQQQPGVDGGGGSSFQDMLQGLYGSLNGRNSGLDQGAGMMGQREAISRFGRYPEGPSMGIAPNPQMVPSSAPSVGGISRPGGGMGGGIAAPSPVGGVTNAPPQQPRLWWGGNGGG